MLQQSYSACGFLVVALCFIKVGITIRARYFWLLIVLFLNFREHNYFLPFLISTFHAFLSILSLTASLAATVAPPFLDRVIPLSHSFCYLN